MFSNQQVKNRNNCYRSAMENEETFKRFMETARGNKSEQEEKKTSDTVEHAAMQVSGQPISIAEKRL